ncbi:hypothetical protein DPMN_135573 [Dreissena polymorpha]|uniref:C1q domain-containing protein n=1 Tax=Dreissena polymorpha TaxID=45954 RepID=A0A9D4G253_DREPO|nr:hypothetical protein DPMN_135573 [Dreissena polymorpha]
MNLYLYETNPTQQTLHFVSFVIPEDLKTPTILFRAQLASTITVSTGQDVVFTRVEVNEGQGYNKVTGKFTASVAGLYHFAVHYCTQDNKWVYLEIVHNGKSLQSSAHYGAASAYQCSSLQAYVVIVMGDTVWVRTTATSHLFQSGSLYTNTFSGVLIRA